MKYALLIHDDEAAWAAMSEEDRNQLLKEYGEFSNDVVERGLMRGGEQLQPSSAATTVRIRDDKTITADGPFADTKVRYHRYREPSRGQRCGNGPRPH